LSDFWKVMLSDISDNLTLNTRLTWNLIPV